RHIGDGQGVSEHADLLVLRDPAVIEDHPLLQSVGSDHFPQELGILRLAAGSAKTQLYPGANATHGLDEEVLALVLLDPANADDLVAILAVSNTLRVGQGWVEDLAVDSVE